MVASLTRMSRLEVLPFDQSHLADAGRLLAQRHRGHRAAEPRLDPRYEDAMTAEHEVAAVLAVEGSSGSVAVRDGRVVGYLVGAPKPVGPWGPNMWVESAGQAVERAEDIRDLYAGAAPRWVDEGRIAQYVLVPAHDHSLVEAWFRLAFGHQHTHAVRDVPSGPTASPPHVLVRGPRRDDLPTLARLDLELPLHQGLAPTFSAGELSSYEEKLKEWEDDIDDPEFTTFVAEYDGRIVGSAVGCRLEKSSANAGLVRPENAGFLGFAAVFPDARGLGVGRALGEAVLELVRGPGALVHRHRLARDQPAVVPGLAGSGLPSVVPAAAPVGRVLIRECTGARHVRIVEYRADSRTARVYAVSCATQVDLLFRLLARGIRAGRPLGRLARTDTNAPGHPAGAFRAVAGDPGVAGVRAPTERNTMVIVMTPEASAEDIARVVEKVEEVGGEAFVSKGVVRTIIGLVGDIESFHHLNLRSLPGVADVHRISDPYKLVSRQHHRDRSTVWVRGVPIGPDTFTFIAGPCAVESPGQTLEAAEMAKAAGATLMRGGAFKPRTSPYAFQGLGFAGLEILSAVREATGLPIVTEVVDARDVTVVAEHADMLQVGTRNMANFGLLQAVGEAGKPVLLKRGMTATHRGVADGRGVHRAARQPRHRALRARDPDVRAEHPQHARHLRGAGRAGDQPPSGDRRPVARGRPQGPGGAALAGSHRGRARTASSWTCIPTRRRRCATGRRR